MNKMITQSNIDYIYKSLRKNKKLINYCAQQLNKKEGYNKRLLYGLYFFLENDNAKKLILEVAEKDMQIILRNLFKKIKEKV